MKKLPLVVILCTFLLGFVALQAAPKVTTTAEAYFSPKGGCTEAVVNALGKAKQTILVQAYSFTSAPIAEALTKAFKRGVKVQVILDKSNRTEKYSAADFVSHAGIPTLIDAQHQIMHSKVMILDSETVITGSFNFTHNAEEDNAENLLILQSKELAAQYTKNWKLHAAHSEIYEGNGDKKMSAVKKDSHKKSTGWHIW